MRRALILPMTMLVVLAPMSRTQASTPKLTTRTIIAVENHVRKLPYIKSTLVKCVRVYTVEMRKGKALGIGIIVLPGRGFGFPADVKVPNVNPKLMKPGYYIVKPEQMPTWPVSYSATDDGMYSISFDPQTGALLAL